MKIALSAHSRGDLDNARELYRAELKKNPNNELAMCWLGAIEAQRGNYLEAEQLMSKAISLGLKDESLLQNYANIFFETGRFDRALGLYSDLFERSPDNEIAIINLATCYNELGSPKQALDLVERALKKRPSSADLLLIKANAFNTQGKHDDAIHILRNIVNLSPGNKDAWASLGAALNQKHLYAESLSIHERALGLNNKNHKAWTNYGVALAAEGRLKDALAAHKNSISLLPTYENSWINKGVVLYDLGRYDEALGCYNEALKLNPQSGDALLNKSLLLLKFENFKDGFNLYSHRWMATGFEKKNPIKNIPYWTGADEKIRLLLQAEQGLGDEIFYAGLFHKLKRMRMSVTVSCDSRLKAIFCRSFPWLEVIDREIGANDMVVTAYDAQAWIGDLPKLLAIKKDDLLGDRHPYISADEAKTKQIKASLGLSTGQKVCGLSWRSFNRKIGKNKSICLNQLSPLLSLKNWQFVSLQYGDIDTELRDSRSVHQSGLFVHPSIDTTNDMNSTLSLVHACDMVITTSNVTAHLAGAIGKKAALLLPFSRGRIWYWQKRDSHSLWYPSLRIFEQSSNLDWDKVVRDVVDWVANEH